jgi:hypothetical protein
MPQEPSPGVREAKPVVAPVQPVADEAELLPIRDARTVPRAGAPVYELSGKERAGVYLTWGVLGLICLFLGIAFAVLLTSPEPSACKVFDAPGGHVSQTVIDGKLSIDTVTALMQQCETQRESFRKFWLQSIQMILLNMLLPVLTALLGYVFGTQSNSPPQ